MPVLDLPMGSRAKVFRRTVEILQADPTLDAAITTWVTWDGAKISLSPDLSSMCPVLRFEPNIGPMSWYDPSSQYGALVVKVGMAVQSRHAEDYLNLWEALENALYPRGDLGQQFAIQGSLREAGAETGQWEFALPASDPNPRETEDGIFACVGMMRISVIRTFG